MEIVEEKPHSVYVGSFPRCDYEYMEDEVDGEERDDGNDSSSGRLQRRGALHELCRRFNYINSMKPDEFELSQLFCRREKPRMLQLARQMVIASHCSANRSQWEQKKEYCFDRSILVLYESDQTPLHILCSGIIDLDTIMVLLESITSPEERSNSTIKLPTVLELLSNQNNLGVTPLHYLANNRSCPTLSLSKILEFAKQNEPREAANNLIVDGPQETSLEEAMMMEDQDDLENPLHWAMSSQVSPEHLKILLQYGGIKPLWRCNLEGNFPMDTYAKTSQEDLLVSDNEAATEADNLNAFESYLANAVQLCPFNDGGQKEDTTPTRWLPLHHMASSICFPCPEYMFDLAIRSHGNDMLMEYDGSPAGLMPLHLALLSPKQKGWEHVQSSENSEVATHAASRVKHVVLTILQHSEESARMPSRHGRLPLHYAVESNFDLEIIMELVRHYPTALTTADPVQKGLPPFALAAVEENSCLDVVFELLRLCPSALVWENSI